MVRNMLNNRHTTVPRLILLIVLGIAVVLFGGRSFISNTDLGTTAYAQQDALLERRISQIEQRFYYIESRINRLEQQSNSPGILSGTSSRNEAEVGLLRTQLEELRTQIASFRLRLGEVECGLIKVDERTLATAIRDARRRADPNPNDPCRVNPSMPIRLSVRP